MYQEFLCIYTDIFHLKNFMLEIHPYLYNIGFGALRLKCNNIIVKVFIKNCFVCKKGFPVS